MLAVLDVPGGADAEGARLQTWEIRALVPTLGNGGKPLWDEGCPQACREAIERSGGMRLPRSGEAGIADEWVLRMPVGQPFDLGPRSLSTQDILDEQARRLDMVSTTEAGRAVSRPANVRVTLLDVCSGQVRVGALARLEFVDHARVPIPDGFGTIRWVQLTGCGALAPVSAAPPDKGGASETAIAR